MSDSTDDVDWYDPELDDDIFTKTDNLENRIEILEKQLSKMEIIIRDLQIKLKNNNNNTK